jgi:hypothetical protein
MSYAEEWEPTNFDASAPLPTPEPRGEKPERWFRDNAAVFHAEQYESEHGRPPSSLMREKNKAGFRRLLCERHGRGEPDAAWLDMRIAHLEKRGLSPERERFSR